jgi:ligand-binding SRPBCC domain-containing protein
MPTLEFTAVLAAPLDAVWAFHQDVSAALPVLSPPGSDVRVVSADLPARVGQRVEVAARGPLGVRLRMVARIVEFRPPPDDAAAGGGGGAVGSPAMRSAVFIDEQEPGPFAAWRHEHRFDAVDDRTTRLTDRVTYRVPLGPLGRLADRLFVRRQLVAMFEHRHAATRRAVE